MMTNLSWSDFGAGYNGLPLDSEYETTLSSGRHVVLTGRYGMTNMDTGQKDQSRSMMFPPTPARNSDLLVAGLVCVAIVALVAMVALSKGGNNGRPC